MDVNATITFSDDSNNTYQLENVTVTGLNLNTSFPDTAAMTYDGTSVVPFTPSIYNGELHFNYTGTIRITTTNTGYHNHSLYEEYFRRSMRDYLFGSDSIRLKDEIEKEKTSMDEFSELRELVEDE